MFTNVAIFSIYTHFQLTYGRLSCHPKIHPSAQQYVLCSSAALPTMTISPFPVKSRVSDNRRRRRRRRFASVFRFSAANEDEEGEEKRRKNVVTFECRRCQVHQSRSDVARGNPARKISHLGRTSRVARRRRERSRK